MNKVENSHAREFKITNKAHLLMLKLIFQCANKISKVLNYCIIRECGQVLMLHSVYFL